MARRRLTWLRGFSLIVDNFPRGLNWRWHLTGIIYITIRWREHSMAFPMNHKRISIWMRKKASDVNKLSTSLTAIDPSPVPISRKFHFNFKELFVQKKAFLFFNSWTLDCSISQEYFLYMFLLTFFLFKVVESTIRNRTWIRPKAIQRRSR